MNKKYDLTDTSELQARVLTDPPTIEIMGIVYNGDDLIEDEIEFRLYNHSKFVISISKERVREKDSEIFKH